MKTNSSVESIILKCGSTILPLLDSDLQSKCKKRLIVSLGNGRRNCRLHYYNPLLFLSRFYICDQFHQIMTHCTTEWHNAQRRNDSSNNYKLFIGDSRRIQMFLETLDSEVAGIRSCFPRRRCWCASYIDSATQIRVNTIFIGNVWRGRVLCPFEKKIEIQEIQ